MLQINLLPVRQLKKRAKAKRQLSGMVLLLILTLGILAVTGMLQAKKISGLKTDIADLNREKSKYTPVLRQIDKLKSDRAELDRRTDIIKKLKTDSSLTVRILDEVANRIDNQRMWFVSLNQQASTLKITGVALDNQTVAQFMDNLKASKFVKNVALSNSSLKVVSGRNLKSFELNCAVEYPTEDESNNN